MTSDRNRRHQLKIDSNQLRQIAKTGVRRAAAFLGVGLPVTENYIPTSLELTQHSLWRFFPEPIPKSMAEEVVREFRSWLVGNALRELDLYFSLFLDNIWNMLAWSKLHGTFVSSSHTVKQISSETNAAKKLSMVMSKLGDDEFDTSMLRSMSNARNCLTHNAGVVGPRNANSDGTLQIRWTAFEIRLQQGEQFIIIPPVIIDGIQAPDPSEKTDLVAVLEERRRTFAVGERIELTPGEMHEICLYYSRLADQVIERFDADLTARGLGPAEAAQLKQS